MSTDQECSGTLITPNHVLTAAHCVQNDGTGFVQFDVLSPVTGSIVQRRIAIAACHMDPAHTLSLSFYLHESLRNGRPLEAIAASLGDRCGVLDADPRALSIDGRHDLAVLQLARPIPPSRVAENLRAAACDVFVDPVHILDPLDTRLIIPDLVAVGYGENFVDPSATAVRRFRSVDSVHSTTEVPDPFLPDLPISFIFTITPLGILAAGDDGGPLFVNGLPGFPILGVAHGGVPVDPAFPVPPVDPGASTWIGVGNDAPNRDWVQSRFDLDGDGRIDTACGDLRRGINPVALTDPSSDPDGDGYITGEDTCPNTYNPCQLASDLDHDGVPDDCDAGPGRSDVAGLRGELLPDADQDGIPDITDCEREVFNCGFGEDADGDFVLDACDNCPDVFNPNQTNSDTDARGDACDACPEVGSAMDVDADHDGADDACDNCVDLYNPLQENCNIDAEQALRAPARGDLCDDTPCGETLLGSSEGNGTLASGRPAVLLRMDQVQVDARSMRPQPARTGFRFCRCSSAGVDDIFTRNRCKGDQGDNTGLCAIGANDKYHRTSEALSAPWRQTIMDYPDTVPTFQSEPRLEALIDYRRPSEGVFEPNLVATWKLEQDQLRWSSVFSEPFQPDAELRGVLWTHTPGPRRGDFAPAVERLTSHYYSKNIPAPMEVPTPFPCLHYVGPYLSNAGCPFCGPAFPGPFLALPGNPGLSCGPPFELPVIAIPDLPFDLGPLLPMDPSVLARPDLRWLAPSEPVEWLPADGTRLLALDSQLQAVVRLVETGQGLGLAGGQGGLGCSNGNFCDTTGFPQAFSSAAPPATPTPAIAPASSPPLPSEAVLVLSAREEKFWELRGDAHTRRGLVIAHPLDPTQLYHVDHLALGHVLAATYRAQDQALYVLDEVTHGRGWRRRSQARLLRISTDGAGVLEVLARWPRLSWNTRFALVAAPGEAVWLVASPEPGRGPALHVVLRLEARRRHHGRRARWRPSGLALGFGTLADVQPRIDARGLSLVVERRGQEEAIGYAQGDLHGLRARDLRRCF
ncbi:MAG: trypsin-like serine protease [Deltaproteobacteria bacterium]|nr:trypsin-like serine protease [Deltaproteobacteria bacterium]